jgi:hypothetical protein
LSENGRKELLSFLSVALASALVSLENRLRSLSERPEERLWRSRITPLFVEEDVSVTVSTYMHTMGKHASSYHLPLVPLAMVVIRAESAGSKT